MEKEKKYIIIVRGVLKFNNGEKVSSGKFVPQNIPDNEIEKKLEAGYIVEFDPKTAAAVQAGSASIIGNEVGKLKSEIDDCKKLLGVIKSENVKLKEKIKTLEIVNAELKENNDLLASAIESKEKKKMAGEK